MKNARQRRALDVTNHGMEKIFAMMAMCSVFIVSFAGKTFENVQDARSESKRMADVPICNASSAIMTSVGAACNITTVTTGGMLCVLDCLSTCASTY